MALAKLFESDEHKYHESSRANTLEPSRVQLFVVGGGARGGGSKSSEVLSESDDDETPSAWFFLAISLPIGDGRRCCNDSDRLGLVLA